MLNTCSTPRLFPSGGTLGFAAIVLCATLCQGASDTGKRRHYADDSAEQEAPKKQQLTLETVKPELEKNFTCPISHEIMFDPVMAADGHTYEANAIKQWFSQHDTSPLTNAKLDNKNTIPNHALRNAINEYIKTVDEADRPEAFKNGAVRSKPNANLARRRKRADRPEAPAWRYLARAEPGVEVIGAGTRYANGWYTRISNAKTPSTWFYNGPMFDRESWNRSSGPQWYWKDDGCYIYYSKPAKSWLFIGPDGNWRYSGDRQCPNNLQHTGWEVACRGRAPVPTLRVVH